MGRPYAKPLHPVIIHQASNGSLGITKGKWKLELCKGNGEWVCPYDGKDPKTLPDVQLYDVEADPGETTDLHETHPDVVAALRAELAHCQESGPHAPLSPCLSRPCETRATKGDWEGCPGCASRLLAAAAMARIWYNGKQ